MGTVYIGIILLCRVVQHLYNKKASNMVSGLTQLFQYSGFRQCISAVLALGLILLGGNGFSFDLKTIGLSVLSGLMLTISMSCSLYAMKSGMVALVSLFGTAGLIVPCIAGVFLFEIPVGIMQWAGIALFMIAAYLMIMGSKQAVSGFSFKTLILLTITLLAEGGTMLAQQMFAQYVPDGNVSVFSFLSFGMPAIVMFAVLPIISKATCEEIQPLSKPLIIYGILLAAVILIINQLATLATAIVPPVILFTFINGGSTVIAAVVAALVYKEKLTVRSLAGIILGVVALVIIKTFS